MYKEGRGVVIKGKFKVLKRTNTMHVSSQFQASRVLKERSGSNHSIASDPEDCCEGNEAISRRGRRSAIIDNTNMIGDVEASPATVPSNPNKCALDLKDRQQSAVSTNKSQQLNVSAGNDGKMDKSLKEMSLASDSASLKDRSSIISSSRNSGVSPTHTPMQITSSNIPSVNIIKEQHLKILKKQNTIADLTAKTSSVSSSSLADSETRRKSAKSFLKLIDKKVKSRDSIVDLQDALKSVKRTEFLDNLLMSYYDLNWSDLIPQQNNEASEISVPELECRRRDAVWELFKSELVFLVDHLLVLKHCFMEPLKSLQVDGHLMFIEPHDLYGNLDELCYVSYNFCRDFIMSLTKEATDTDFGQTDFLLRAFAKWNQQSKDGEVFHNYCINYESALSLLDILQKYEPFLEFERWCEMDPRCHRLQLSDLLVAPMQHYTKMPLLLSNIRKYTVPVCEKQQLTDSVHKVENSLRNLEEKMRWLKNFERLQEIQNQLIWLPITEMEPRLFIPEFLRHTLSYQPCERLIANPKRTLLHEGYIFLNDSGKTTEIYAFLFDDFLLFAKIKKSPKKKSVSESNVQSRSPTEGALFTVYRQPIALDRFTIHDVGYVEANANGLRNAFVLVIMSRFQQIIGVHTLQASTDITKETWIAKLRIGQQQFQEKLKFKLLSDGFSSRTNKHSKILGHIKSFHNQPDGSTLTPIDLQSARESNATSPMYLSVTDSQNTSKSLSCHTPPAQNNDPNLLMGDRTSPSTSRHGSITKTTATVDPIELHQEFLHHLRPDRISPSASKGDDMIDYCSLTPGSFSPPLSPTIHDLESTHSRSISAETTTSPSVLLHELRRISQEIQSVTIQEEELLEKPRILHYEDDNKELKDLGVLQKNRVSFSDINESSMIKLESTMDFMDGFNNPVN